MPSRRRIDSAINLVIRQIHNAVQHPVNLDEAQAKAVEARIILDLRVGAAFTRLQTTTLQNRFKEFKEPNNTVISYGKRTVP